MIEMKGNSLLFSLRKKRKLTLLKASRLIKVNPFLLFNMERGYIAINEKYAQKFAQFYDIDYNELMNEGGMPHSIKPHEKDSKRLFRLVKSFFMNKITIIVSLLFTIFGAIASPISGNKLLAMDDDYLSFYNEGYIASYNQVADWVNNEEYGSSKQGTMPLFYLLNGVHTNDYFAYYYDAEETKAERTTLSVNYDTYEEEEETESWLTKIMNFLNKEHMGFSIVDMLNLYGGDDANLFVDGRTSLRFNRDISGANVHFFESEWSNHEFNARLRLAGSDGSYNIDFNIRYSDGNQYILYGGTDLINPLNVYCVLSFSIDSLMLIYTPVDASSPAVSKVGESLKTLYDKGLGRFDKLLSSLGYEGDIKKFASDFLLDEARAKSEWLFLTVFFSISTLLGALSLCILFVGLVLIITKKEGEEERKTPIEKEQDKEKKRDLPRNWPFGPFIKEGYYRLAGLILVFIGNLTAPLVCSSLFGTFTSGKVDLMGAVDAFQLYPFQLFGSFILVSIIMNILIKGKNLPFKASLFMAGGLIYYVLELIVEVQLMRKSSLLAVAVDYLPGNIFWSVGVFAFISLFLFHTPKGCDSKGKEVAYRLCSLIPLSYIAASVVLLYLRKTHAIELPLYVRDLLLQKSNLLLLYGVLFLYGVCALKAFLKRKYGFEKEKLFENSYEYALYQDIVMVLALSVPVLLDLFASGNTTMSVLGFNHNPYLWILLPMFIFLRPRIPERDGILDAAYVVGVSLVWLVPYLSAIIMFVKWLPF